MNFSAIEASFPEVLFEAGSKKLRVSYKQLLNDFFPRYMKVLLPYHGSIEQVLIEGHTSSLWTGLDENAAYFKNMELSQERTRSVLDYVYYLPDVKVYQTWVKLNVAAVGLSSSKLVYSKGSEDSEKSRRVNFRVITDADIQIKRILRDSQE